MPSCTICNFEDTLPDGTCDANSDTTTVTTTTAATTTRTAATNPDHCCGSALSTVHSDDQSGRVVFNLLITACQNLTDGVTLGLR